MHRNKFSKYVVWMVKRMLFQNKHNYPQPHKSAALQHIFISFHPSHNPSHPFRKTAFQSNLNNKPLNVCIRSSTHYSLFYSTPLTIYTIYVPVPCCELHTSSPKIAHFHKRPSAHTHSLTKYTVVPYEISSSSSTSKKLLAVLMN